MGWWGWGKFEESYALVRLRTATIAVASPPFTLPLTESSFKMDGVAGIACRTAGNKHTA